MERNFNKTLKLMTEDNLLLKKSDETYTISPIFATQFIVYCVKNNLRELLFIYMDFHGYDSIRFIPTENFIRQS